MTIGRVRKEGSMGDTVVDVSVFYVNTSTTRRVKVVLERNIDPNVTRSVDSVELRDVARLRTDVVIDRVWHLDYLYAHNYAYIELHTVRRVDAGRHWSAVRTRFAFPGCLSGSSLE